MIPLDKRYVSTEFFDSREHPRFGTWVGLGDVGHEDVGTRRRTKQRKRGSGEAGTRELGDAGRKNAGTQGRGDSRTCYANN